MSRRTAGMGRGLAAILAVSDEPAQPRTASCANSRRAHRARTRASRGARFDEEALQALADSRARARVAAARARAPASPGGTYELVAGERRWRAAQLAGLESMPALVRPRDDAHRSRSRSSRTWPARTSTRSRRRAPCAALVEELGLTREEVGRRVGRSRVAVSNLLRLLDLPDEALGCSRRGELTEGHGRALLLAEDHADRRRLAREAARRGLVGARHRGEGARGQRARATHPRASRGRAACTPTRRPPRPRSARRSGGALGVEVRVRPTRRGGYRVELAFDDAEQAHELAARLAGRQPRLTTRRRRSLSSRPPGD